MNDLEDRKAVEFRTFLLYSGPVVLKGFLSDEQYEHIFLKLFSNEFGVIYGRHQLIYNVHSLSHLENDCRMLNEPLDCFSAFPFGNFLGRLKVLLRGTKRPLAQLKKRLSEIDNFDNFKQDDINKHH